MADELLTPQTDFAVGPFRNFVIDSLRNPKRSLTSVGKFIAPETTSLLIDEPARTPFPKDIPEYGKIPQVADPRYSESVAELASMLGPPSGKLGAAGLLLPNAWKKVAKESLKDVGAAAYKKGLENPPMGPVVTEDWTAKAIPQAEAYAKNPLPAEPLPGFLYGTKDIGFSPTSLPGHDKFVIGNGKKLGEITAEGMHDEPALLYMHHWGEEAPARNFPNVASAKEAAMTSATKIQKNAPKPQKSIYDTMEEDLGSLLNPYEQIPYPFKTEHWQKLTPEQKKYALENSALLPQGEDSAVLMNYLKYYVPAEKLTKTPEEWEKITAQEVASLHAGLDQQLGKKPSWMSKPGAPQNLTEWKNAVKLVDDNTAYDNLNKFKSSLTPEEFADYNKTLVTWQALHNATKNKKTSLSDKEIAAALGDNPGASIFDIGLGQKPDPVIPYFLSHDLPSSARHNVPERAAEINMNVPTVHGTAVGTNFDMLALPETLNHSPELGVHSGSPKAAQEIHGGYSRSEKAGPRSIPLVIEANKPLRLPDLGSWEPYKVSRSLIMDAALPKEEVHQLQASNDVDWIKNIRAYIEKKGYDSVVYKNSVEDPGHDSYILFRESEENPGYVKGARVPWAAFDPNKRNMANLIAGLGGASILPPLFGDSNAQR